MSPRSCPLRPSLHRATWLIGTVEPQESRLKGAVAPRGGCLLTARALAVTCALAVRM